MLLFAEMLRQVCYLVYCVAIFQEAASAALRDRDFYETNTCQETTSTPSVTPSPSCSGGTPPFPTTGTSTISSACSTTSVSPHRTFDANYIQKLQWFTRFADAFMFPNNTIQAAAINSTLFSENIQGRVDLTDNFDGRELNTEVRYHRR